MAALLYLPVFPFGVGGLIRILFESVPEFYLLSKEVTCMIQYTSGEDSILHIERILFIYLFIYLLKYLFFSCLHILLTRWLLSTIPVSYAIQYRSQHDSSGSKTCKNALHKFHIYFQ